MSGWTASSTRRVVEIVRALWFVPAVMATAGVALGLVMPLVDAIPDVLVTIRFGWLRGVLDAGASGSQQLLATSAGALATILGVAFSLTLVTLQLAAAQYTPRLVGRLLEDPVTKVVLGSYIGTVAYLLLVLRSVHGTSEDQETFVPRLSIFLGLLLILACLALLAYFVHHLGQSLQASNVGTRVTNQTIATLRRLERAGGEPVLPVPAPPDDGVRLESDRHGYVQTVSLDQLRDALPDGVRWARVEVGAGDHVLPGTPLLTVWPARALGEEETGALLGAFALGPQRTIDHDVLYGVRQLADIGLKALSPGMNDETTAVTVVNQLGAVLSEACGHPPDPAGWRLHHLDGVTVLVPSLTVRRLVEDAFAGLVRFSADHPRVLARMVELLGDVASRQPPGDRRDAILEVAGWVEHAASQGTLAPHERRLLEVRLAELRAPRTRAPADRPHAMH